MLGLLSLGLIWRRRHFVSGLLVASLYWMSQEAAITFPGITFIEPEFADRLPRVGGVVLNQLGGVVVCVMILGASYLWARRTTALARAV